MRQDDSDYGGESQCFTTDWGRIYVMTEDAKRGDDLIFEFEGINGGAADHEQLEDLIAGMQAALALGRKLMLERRS